MDLLDDSFLRRERIRPEMGTVLIPDYSSVDRDMEGGVLPQFTVPSLSRSDFSSPKIWRKPMIPYIINQKYLHKNILSAGEKRKETKVLPEAPLL